MLFEMLYNRNKELHESAKSLQKQYSRDEELDFLLLKDIKGGHNKVLKSDIIMIRSDDHYQKVYTKEEYYYVRSTIRFFEQALDKTAFLKVHRSAVVNIKCVKKISPYGNGEYVMEMTNGKSAKVSRRYAKEVKRILLA